VSEVEALHRRGHRWDAIRAEFVEAQSGLCAICDKNIVADPHLDHCHVTGFIRGALCCSCNTKLGWCEKHRQRVEEYLSRAGEFEAYRVAEHIKKPKQQKSSAPEWVRRYWQNKAEHEQRKTA